MSALIGHAKAARILGEVFTEEFTMQTDPALAALAGMLAHGFSTGAERMEQAMREEATGYEDVP